MLQCSKCKGTGKLKVLSSVYGNSGVSNGEFTMPCVYCDGKGQITLEKKAKLDWENSLWCKCGNPSRETSYKADGEGPDIHKHHWRCNDCGKIVQIG